MSKKPFEFRVPKPCSEKWVQMTGDDRTRTCARCDHDIHNIAALDETQKADLIEQSRAGAKVCVRLSAAAILLPVALISACSSDSNESKNLAAPTASRPAELAHTEKIGLLALPETGTPAPIKPNQPEAVGSMAPPEPEWVGEMAAPDIDVTPEEPASIPSEKPSRPKTKR